MADGAGSSSAHPLVRIDGVSRRFAEVTALDRVSLDIGPGEFFALLGPSGCGKTTLLRMLAGFERPDEGRILLDGVDITRFPPHRRPINMMFQSYALFPHLSVEGNVAFGLKQERLPRTEIRARVAEMLALVQLEGLAARKPHQLSGGQRQRVALARSLVKRPRLVLLDEPLAALDKKLRGETQFELIRLQKELGLTFVIVTHDQQEAMTVADRIGVMNEGRLVQVAAPPEIYEQPCSRWVAGFIGDVNLIEGRVAEIDKGSILVATAAGMRLRVRSTVAVGMGEAAWIALRPEKVRIALEQPFAAVENCLRGEVMGIGYFGEASVYSVRVDGGFVVKAAVANTTRSVERRIGRADAVWLTWTPDAGVVLMR